MFREAGNDVGPEEAHEYLKMHVGKLHKIITGPSGDVAIIGGSTTALSTTEFMDYCEKIRAWAAQFGWIIPLPGEIGPEAQTPGGFRERVGPRSGAIHRR